MKNLEDKLAASIKPTRARSPAKPKTPDAAPKPTGEQSQEQTPVNAPVERQKQMATRKKPPTPQQPDQQMPRNGASDLNEPGQPLHPKRIWPD